MAKKLPNNKFVLAAKDMNGFLSNLEKGLLRMPGKAEDYKVLFSSIYLRLDNIKDLGKFIKKIGLNRDECGMYWEALIQDGFTLFATESVRGDSQVNELCDGKNIKFLTTARK